MTSNSLELLPTVGDPRTWTPQQSALMQFAGLATVVQSTGQVILKDRAVTEAFLLIVARTGLDPIAKQIYAAEVGGKYTVLVGVDGMRLTAQRSGEYEGQTPKQWQRSDGEWVNAWTPQTWGEDPAVRPLAARVGIYRKGFREPLWSTVTWEEFGQTPSSPKQNWNVRPAHMLGIRAETHGLRTAFPMELSDLYTQEDFSSDTLTLEGESEEKQTITTVAAVEDRAELERIYQTHYQTGTLTDALGAAIMARAGILRAQAEAEQQKRQDEAAAANVVDAEEIPADPETGEVVEQEPDVETEEGIYQGTTMAGVTVAADAEPEPVRAPQPFDGSAMAPEPIDPDIAAYEASLAGDDRE